MQQQAALTNIQIDKFIGVNESEDPINDNPPTSQIPTNKLCVVNFCVKYLINDPPHKYPKALMKNIYENDVQDYPVAYAKYGMIGPIPVIILP